MVGQYSEEGRNRIREANKARVWTPEMREAMRVNLSGENNPQFGKPCKGKKKMSVVRKAQGNPWNIGRPLSEPHKERIRIAQQNNPLIRGEKCHLWKGGISFEPYCPKFNNAFKERVRAFFKYQCQGCGAPQNVYKLHVHHVNFNKMSCCDNTPPHFVPLCRSCHGKTQGDRGRGEIHYTNLIETKYGGKCYLTETEMILNKV